MRHHKDLIIYLKDYRTNTNRQSAPLRNWRVTEASTYLWEGILLFTLLSAGAASLFLFNHELYELMEETAIFIN